MSGRARGAGVWGAVRPHAGVLGCHEPPGPFFGGRTGRCVRVIIHLAVNPRWLYVLPPVRDCATFQPGI